jgi:starch synthase
MRVLFVASECAPFAKTGGLGDVVGALPKALARQGIETRVVLPLYAGVPRDGLERREPISVPMWYGPCGAGVWRGALPESSVPVHFLEHHDYFSRPGLYGDAGGDYADNLERFAFLSRGALALATALGWTPDVVHAHDWQAALAPVYLDTVERDGPLGGAASVLTVHNVAFQGSQDLGALPVAGLPDGWCRGDFEHFGSMNVLKAGLLHGTLLTTVSPTYAAEIQTPAAGHLLDGVLAHRRRALTGLLNGIDDAEWNPAHDPHLPAGFTAGDLAGKAACKAALQVETGLPVRPDVPVFAVVSRLAWQKGIDVLADVLERVLAWELQVVVLGTGASDLEDRLQGIAARHPERIGLCLRFDDARAHRTFAGADFLAMPSRYEPCGLSQLYAMRYGALPIVRATGGLADTVESYDEQSGAGTGFVLHDLHPASLADTIGWALGTWWDRPAHLDALRRRAMAQDFSWTRAAAAYRQVYEAACAIGRDRPA